MNVDPNDLQVEEIRIVIRPYDPEIDEACVYSTWRNQAYYSAKDKPIMKPDKFFSLATFNIKKIMQTARCKVACLYDHPSTILGYVVYTDDHLDWIYVKSDYRKTGIGTLLWPKEIKTVTCYLTKIGAKIADMKNLKIKENENGNPN